MRNSSNFFRTYYGPKIINLRHVKICGNLLKWFFIAQNYKGVLLIKNGAIGAP